jgi:hypothetical protein
MEDLDPDSELASEFSPKQLFVDGAIDHLQFDATVRYTTLQYSTLSITQILLPARDLHDWLN